ncbi:MAG: Transcriptional regulatory protein RstA, partial [Pseudomonadota bacterium]
GRLCLDPASRVATCGPRTIPLTWSEFDLLWILSVNAGRVVPRVDLHQVVTGTPYDAATRSIDVHVSRLRRKLETAGFTQATVTAVRFQGYVLLPG